MEMPMMRFIKPHLRKMGKEHIWQCEKLLKKLELIQNKLITSMHMERQRLTTICRKEELYCVFLTTCRNSAPPKHLPDIRWLPRRQLKRFTAFWHCKTTSSFQI